MFRYLLVCLICCSGSIGLLAQIVTDRPDQTESSSTVGKGNLQIESGLVIAYEDSAELSNRQILAPSNLLRFGITSGVEIRFLSQYESNTILDKTVSGISDLEIGTKIQLLQKENVNTEIAFLSHLILPSGTKELSLDEYGTINKLSISHELNEALSIGYNVGYDYFGQGNGDLTYSLALGIAVNDKVGVYIEPYGAYMDFDNYVQNFDAGFTYLANPNLQFDFSFGTGISDRSNYISVGASWLLLKA